MANPTNIVELAERLIIEATERPKVASVAAPVVEKHPIVAMLKKVAEELRSTPDDESGDLAEAQKLAAALQPGTGAQSPGQSAGLLSATPPSLPALKTSNLGATAGAGGAPATSKIASELRSIASELRSSEDVSGLKIAHVLNAACGLHHLREGL